MPTRTTAIIPRTAVIAAAPIPGVKNIVPRSVITSPGLPAAPASMQSTASAGSGKGSGGGGGVGAMASTGMTAGSSEAAQHGAGEETPKFLWMPRPIGIGVAIAGVSLLAFGLWKMFGK